MRMITCSALVLGLAPFVLGGVKPLATVTKFDGKFAWVKLNPISPDSIKTLGHASAFTFNVNFTHDVKLKKDASGNAWFTFVLADQGGDWKWHQSSQSAIVKSADGLIKAGRYALSIPTKDIPKAVLADKTQTISLGPATSGLAAPISFTVDGLRGQ